MRGIIFLSNYGKRRYGILLDGGHYCAFRLLDRLVLTPHRTVGGALDRPGIHYLFSEEHQLISVAMKIINAERDIVEHWVKARDANGQSRAA